MGNTKCSILDCNNKKRYKIGWCQCHYMIWYRYGNPISYRRSKQDGKSKSNEYGCWQGMKQRCYDKNHPSYKHYGGRGIKVCDRWTEKSNGFSNFLEDMGSRPKGYSVDRINNDGSYTPENCRWATPSQQTFNQRMRSDNTSGCTGVYRFRSRWVARIKINKQEIFLGSFRDRARATEARRLAEIKHGIHKPQIIVR